ncbi:unnamed protein product [Adineta ricciae]|uniref:Uncharacterized protein n=1 Tax=Adineta ricciae TaxID=249248 RepID=A0A814QJY0_ADIRI|nr:unnamed protein product [Adineta ricciae]
MSANTAQRIYAISVHDHAKRADVCLILGSSLWVTPAAHIPMLVNEQGGKLAIGNLQSTLLASLAELNVHIMRDDIIQRLIVQLEISIPEEELDLSHDITYTLFAAIRINVKQNEQVLYDSKSLKREEPIEKRRI